MTQFILAYLAGVLTIATPCIVPILPFVLARADEPFRRGGLPILLGLAFGFAAVASLASFAGAWAIEANRHGRAAALALVTLFGLAMLQPALAARLTAPLVAIGARLSDRVGRRQRVTMLSSMLLGIATGLIWAPCAGPVLGLILTSAALRGPSVETSLLLMTYGLGAATSLAAGLLLGGRVLAAVKRSAPWGEGVRRILGAAVVAGAAIIWLGLDTGALTRLSTAGTNHLERNLIAAVQAGPGLGLTASAYAAPEPVLSGPERSLLGAQQWLNTPPLKSEDLSGKVVLVNFWTYSCINCLRVLPHVRAWAEKYRDRGLVVIGVHTPEFAFEKDAANVSKALDLLGVSYPVALDSDFGIWRAFNNNAWPALYFIDADGRIRDRALGEGDYEESERLIQQLLSEANGASAASGLAAVSAPGPQAAPDERDLGSDETYVGYRHATNFASPGGARNDVPNLYHTASALALNRWSLDGNWTVGREFATLNDPSGRIAYRFHARDLHLVMGPAADGHPVRFRVTIDGAAPGANHGSDVDAEGWGTLQEDRLYQLVRQAGPVTDRTFQIEFAEPGVRAYAFTFG
jgi:cytochrome c biogenesis protein CcdA/thiol-disulfide isomerase/thioredoxin